MSITAASPAYLATTKDFRAAAFCLLAAAKIESPEIQPGDNVKTPPYKSVGRFRKLDGTSEFFVKLCGQHFSRTKV